MRVTLELPPEVVRRGKIVARETERTLEEVLTEWLEWGAQMDDLDGPALDTVYPIDRSDED